MKPLLTLSLLCCLLALNVDAQKWLWVKEAENDTIKYPDSYGDPWSAATDKNGDFFEEGLFGGGVFFGPKLITSPATAINTYIAKYSPSGNVLWVANAIIPSASCVTFGTSVATDNNGNSFITGIFSDTVSFGTYTLTNGGRLGDHTYYGDIFLVKYDPNGNVLWARSTVKSANANNVTASSVTTDASGNAYITGMYEDSITFGGYTLVSQNIVCPFLAKYDPNGNVLWAKSGLITGSDGGSGGYGVTTDKTNNIYVTGWFSDTVNFGGHTLFCDTITYNMFLVKYDSSGNVLWAIDAKEANNNLVSCEGQAITYDGTDIYIAGTYQDTITLGSQILVAGVSLDYALFLAKYNSNGNVLWAQSSSGQGVIPYSLSTGIGGGLYFCGTFEYSIAFGSSLLTSNGGEPSFIYKFDSLGNVLCSTNIENVNDDNNGVAADPLTDAVYFTGDVTGRACAFGDTTLYGGGEEWAFLGKWTCDCKIGTTISNPDTICTGSSVKLSVSGGTGFSWSPASGLSSSNVSDPIATPTVTTTYTVTITEGTCSGTGIVPVVVRPGPVINICCDTVLQQGNSVQLSASGGVSYNWEPSYGLSCNTCPDPVADPLQNTTYLVTISTDSGCSVQYPITVDISCGIVFVPEAFSPNGDGQNDVLYVRGDCIKTMQFEVFDRWGNKVFETESPTIGWDGRCRGEATNTGSYVYYLKATLYDGSSIEKKGNVELVR